ncbi:MAG: DUF3822 family protein [Chitinophagaceae bacterium]|jgi:hypothetical protein|nr:DUF3822 family protein [Chitinophagaceae bacterium]
MVKLSFQYGTGQQAPFEASTRYLVLDIGPQCLAVLVCQSQTGQVEAAELYTGIASPEADWQEMVTRSSLLGYRHLETRVVFHFGRAMAIPSVLFQPAAATAQLGLLYGRQAAQLPSSDIHRHQGMIWYWEAPALWHQLLRRHFEQFTVSHVGSWMAGLLNTPEDASPTPEAGSGVAVFYPGLAWMGIATAGALHTLRPVKLGTPHDAAYFMLALTQQAGLQAGSTPWHCYGMLEADSALWQSIGEHLSMATLPQPAPRQPLPHWYFGYLMGPRSFL